MKSFVSALFGFALIMGGFISPTVAQTPEEHEANFKYFMNEIIGRSVYMNDVDPTDLYEAAYEAVIKKLGDKHAGYMPPRDFTEAREDTFHGEQFAGIGAALHIRDDRLFEILQVFRNSPAQMNDLRPRDLIVSVGGISLTQFEKAEAIDRIKGPEGTPVELGIRRGDQEFTLTVTRKFVEQPTVVSAMHDGILLVQMQKFRAGVANDIFREFINHYMDETSVRGMILDLRGNPGGLLDEAIHVSDLFLESGKLIVTSRYADGSEDEFKSQVHKMIGVPLVVLIDDMSASASEIVAGTLKEHKRAIIVGGQSYGKGSVQTVPSLDGGAGFRFTIARFFVGSSKRAIDQVGVSPNFMEQIDVPNGLDEIKRFAYMHRAQSLFDPELDQVLARALQILETQ